MADTEHRKVDIIEILDLLAEINDPPARSVVRVLIAISIYELDHASGEMNSIDAPQDINEGFLINVIGNSHSSITCPLIQVVVAVEHVLYLPLRLPRHL